jgi:hypothetical protein
MWQQLFPTGSFRDERLRTRTIVLLDALMKKPGASFAAVFGKCAASVKAAYRFCENRRLSLLSVLVPTFRAVGGFVRDTEAANILCIQDTTELELSHLKAMLGLGETGNPQCRGLFLHCGLAVTPDGVPLGLLSAQTWIRESTEHGKAATRRARAFDDKESVKWWKTIEIAERAVKKPGVLVHIADRESDVFDLYARCQASGYRELLRSRTDRALSEGAQHARLRAEARSWRVRGERLVHVPARPARDGKPARPARDAVLRLRFGEVSFPQPRCSGSLTMAVILACEEIPPIGEEPIEWLLLTTDRLDTFAAASLRIDWYIRRWLIEEFHKCIKSACRAEERQFDERDHLEVALALFLLVSARLLQLRNLARAEPEMPADIALSSDEIMVLQAHFPDTSPTMTPSLRSSVRMIAILGGFMARKGDGEPGFLTLSRGYTQLDAMVLGYRLARDALSAPKRSAAGPPPTSPSPLPPRG